MNEISKVEYTDIPVNYKEIARYAGAKTLDDGLKALIDKCLEEANNAKALKFSICYTLEDIKIEADEVDFGVFKFKSAGLARVLTYSCKALIFASTMGVGIDKLIRKYSAIEPSKALIFQAIGTERIESFLDYFEEQYKKENGIDLANRFSPGFGDLSLGYQKEVFALLKPEKNIGVTLNDSLLMSPSKSVTGIIGIGKKNGNKGCATCSYINCEFRG